MLNSEKAVKEKEGKRIEGPGFFYLLLYGMVWIGTNALQKSNVFLVEPCYKLFAPNFVFGINVKILTNHLAKH